MGIEPFKVGSSLVCVISQRLVKKICVHCKEAIDITPAQQRLFKTDLTRVHHGKGCAKCNHTGYSGRMAVFETVLIDAALEEMISKNAGLDDMRIYAQDKGIPMLREEVVHFIELGITTVDEGLRILYNVEN